MKTSEKILSAVASTVKGTSFVSISNYFSKTSGDTNNYLIQLGYSHENAMLNDFSVLKEKQNEIFSTFEKEYNTDLIKTAYAELYESLEKRLSSDETKEKLRLQNDSTINRSDAQSDAFVTIAKGVKQNKETLLLHIVGLEVRKKLVEKSEIEKKETKSSDKTILKNKIKKHCEFREAKIRSFVFENTTIKMQGLTIKS